MKNDSAQFTNQNNLHFIYLETFHAVLVKFTWPTWWKHWPTLFIKLYSQCKFRLRYRVSKLVISIERQVISISACEGVSSFKQRCVKMFLLKLEQNFKIWIKHSKSFWRYIMEEIRNMQIEFSRGVTFPCAWFFVRFQDISTSSPAHLFAIRGRRKRGPGILQTRD